MTTETQPVALKDLLTPKELEVTQLLVAGHSTASIAVELGVRPGTIRSHLSSIYKRSGYKGRMQLASKWFLENSPYV